MKQYFIYKNNLVRGPFSEETMIKMLQKNEINWETLVSEGRGLPWKTADKIEGLKQTVQTAADYGDEVVFYCPHCHCKYRAERNWVGREVICSSCKKMFVVPDENVEQSQSSVQQPPTDPAPSAGNADNIPEGDLLCPHCWQKFSSEYLLYIAAHPSLMGDPLLGSSAMKRFSPSSFNAMGQAIDPMGQPTSDMACPRCRLKVPPTIIEEESLFFSLVGAPSSGKSYYLASLLHQLKTTMAEKFSYSLLDVDPELNRVLDGYEETIFRAPHRDQVAVLPKTQQNGDDFVDVVNLNNLPVQLPKPFIYELRSRDPQLEGQSCNFNLVFYDNAGEHFEPGADNLTNPGTRHLAHSNGIIFIFDPLNDALMRSCCRSDDPQLNSDVHVYDQTRLMSEMILRIRKHRNMSSNEHCRIPLVIAVGKYDGWKDALDKKLEALDPIEENVNSAAAHWNRNMVMDVSFALREMLLKYVPELIHTAESFFEDVTVIPFSSFGCPARASESGQLGVIPNEIRPIWATEPLLSLLASNGVIEVCPLQAPPEAQPMPQLQNLEGSGFLFHHPETGQKIRLPQNYGGCTLHIGTRDWMLPGKFVPQTPRIPGNSKIDDLWK